MGDILLGLSVSSPALRVTVRAAEEAGRPWVAGTPRGDSDKSETLGRDPGVADAEKEKKKNHAAQGRKKTGSKKLAMALLPQTVFKGRSQDRGQSHLEKP